jgi:hypothetical protein
MKKGKLVALALGTWWIEALAHFKVANKIKNFNIVHCRTTVVRSMGPMMRTQNTGNPVSSMYMVPPKRDASLQSITKTIKTLLPNKEVSSKKMGERKHRRKEETIRNYYEIQRKKLEIEEINARAST